MESLIAAHDKSRFDITCYSGVTNPDDITVTIKKESQRWHNIASLSDEEVAKIQTDLISEKDFQKLQNQFESQFVNSNSSIEGIAGSLATYYMLYGDVNLINNEIDIYRNITREDIQAVAKKYLNPNQRLILDYLPKKDDQ